MSQLHFKIFYCVRFVFVDKCLHSLESVAYNYRFPECISTLRIRCLNEAQPEARYWLNSLITNNHCHCAYNKFSATVIVLF